VRSVKRAVTVHLGRLASQAIGVREKNGNGHASSSAAKAIRCYLGAKQSRTSGWSYPSFLDRRRADEDVELQLDLDDELWKSLEREAENQKISAEQMLEHAVLYFAAEGDAGRIAERILEDLGGS
jgi:hypothetical protein